MRLDVHLDTDPAGTGRRVRAWALVAVLVVVILAELLLLAVIGSAVLDGAAVLDRITRAG